MLLPNTRHGEVVVVAKLT